jgi:ABC-type antimicrobial peptide transport system permease subunit
MTVTRPLAIAEGDGGVESLTEAERQRLREQAGPGPGLDLADREPGSTFSIDTFTATRELTFAAAQTAEIAALDGVEAAAGSLTLSANHVSGTVPEIDVTQGGGPGGAPARGAFGDSDITFDSRSVTGVDQTMPDIAAVTPSQISDGAYFSATGAPRQAIVSAAYAGTEGVAVGDIISLGGKDFRVIGIATSPIGGTASDVYVKLATLQSVAGFADQINAVRVRAASGDVVATVAASIGAGFDGVEVTTATDLAERVGGSLEDARELSSTLGTVLVIVGLVAAVLIASLLTLASVSKRVRELGTLKALGWSRGAVVRQISGESLIQGVMGGVVGALLGVLASLAIGASGWTLQASVADTAGAAQAASGPGGTPGGGPFGLGRAAITTGSEVVEISATPSSSLILLAVGLAAAGGLIAGAAGSLRAARLRPAAALRTVE